MRGYHLTMIASLAALLVALPVLAAEPGTVASPADIAAEKAMLQRCSKGAFDIDAVLADPAARKNLSFLTFEEAMDLTLYGTCRSMTGAADACASLAGLDGWSKDIDVNCRKLEFTFRMASVAVRGGDSAAACRELSAGMNEKERGPAARACALIIKAVRAGDVYKACPEMEKQGFIARNECRENLACWTGKPQACSAIKDRFTKRQCLETAALLAGLRDPARCAASPFCLSLEKRSPSACDGLRRSFAAALCGRQDKVLAEKVKQLQLQQRAAKEREAHAAAQAAADAKLAASAARRKAAREAALKGDAKSQFKEGQPMKGHPKEVQEMMDRIEKGLPPQPVPGEKKDADSR